MKKSKTHTQTKTPQFFESIQCKNCNHWDREHESFNKVHAPKKMPEVIYWNCKICTCRMFTK